MGVASRAEGGPPSGAERHWEAVLPMAWAQDLKVFLHLERGKPNYFEIFRPDGTSEVLHIFSWTINGELVEDSFSPNAPQVPHPGTFFPNSGPR